MPRQKKTFAKQETGQYRFLDALASLDSKLSVSQSVIDVFQLAHLRVCQSYFFIFSPDVVVAVRIEEEPRHVLFRIFALEGGGG